MRLCVASLSGAWAYIQLELPAEEQRYALKKVRAADVEDAYHYMSSLFWHYQGKNMSFVQWDRQVGIVIWAQLYVCIRNGSLIYFCWAPGLIVREFYN